MLTNNLKPIRLLLQLLTADQFIGERDKVAVGKAVDLKRQGNCGRLQIVTSSGSCVWRLTASVVDAILTLWRSLDTAMREDEIFYDSELDRLASGIVNAKNDNERRWIWSIVCPMLSIA